VKARSEFWMDKPEAHDYGAARDILTLLLDAKRTAALVRRLRHAPLIRRKAKDILRTSGLPVLPKDNPLVAHHLKKVREGKRLSPVLLVRGDLRRGMPLVIADGYHRICASWHIDENAPVPSRMVPRP
jgi:hypothetical protein